MSVLPQGLTQTIEQARWLTADAMHTQVDTARWITRRGGHYLLTPLGNQKTLHRTLKDLPWKKVPSFSSVDTGHGRRARRTVKAVEAPLSCTVFSALSGCLGR